MFVTSAPAVVVGECFFFFDSFFLYIFAFVPVLQGWGWVGWLVVPSWLELVRCVLEQTETGWEKGKDGSEMDE